MLETLVWDKVKAIISNRDVVLAELRKQAEMARAQSNITSLDKEIKVIERRLKDYPLQEKRLINAIKTAQFTEDYILDEINRVKAERIADTTRLDELKQAKIHLANLATAEAKLGEFYNIVKERIEHCSDEDKRLAFEALALKVKATSETVEITGVIPVEITAMQSSEALLTIEQTSA
jgi:seryl-tRNA synthetase